MAFPTYRAVALGKKKPAFIRSHLLKVGKIDISGLCLKSLWKLHDDTLSRHRSYGAGTSLLDLKIELVKRMMKSCCLCERKCGINRLAGETGFCGVTNESRCFFEQILWGEEAPIVPSHEVFLSGCNMRCKFCYSWEAVTDTSFGRLVTGDDLARIIMARREEGAPNVSLLGGEPTVNLHIILEALRKIEAGTALVWNSNFYMSEETMKLLQGIVDLYVGDFRFGNNNCASMIGETGSYFETAARNFIMAYNKCELIIRHLVMPGHVDCCLEPIAKWVSENIPDVPFHLMFQYTPFHKAESDPVLGRQLLSEEVTAAWEIVKSYKLKTAKWNRPLKNTPKTDGIGKGEITTTITIDSNGRIRILHLHGELLRMVESFERGG